MKKLAILGINGYSQYVSPLLHNILGLKSACRYENGISCSRYAVQAIEKYGILKGALFSVRRIINCQPFFTI